jgi:4-amino-4-deoxy-L-arabinose transferase-like glycosyltransferase
MTGRLWIIALILISFALRAHALLQLPGFVDEGNHLLWAGEVWQGRVIFPFSTAKALEIFYLAALLPFRSPLWVGRLGSVLAGTVTLAGLWALGQRWKNNRLGLWAAAFYSLNPWTFFHERTAVADPLVTALAVLAAWVAVRWTRRPDRRWTLGLAACLFTLPLAKLSAFPLVLLPAAIVLAEDRSLSRRLLLPYSLAALGLGLCLGAASLRYDVLGELTLRAGDAAGVGWAGRVLMNVSDLVQWANLYAGMISLLMVAGAVVAIAQHTQSGTAGLAGCLLGLALVLAPATSYPRYYLPALAFGSLLAAGTVTFSIAMLRAAAVRRAAAVVLAASLTLSLVNFAALAYRDPAQLPLVRADREQHILGWASGYGIRDAAGFTAGALAGEPQPVAYAANLATRVVAWLYWPPQSSSALHTLWDGNAPDVIEVVAGGRPAYLIVDSTRDSANFQGLTINPHEIARFDRPDGGAPVIVYRLVAEPFAP